MIISRSNTVFSGNYGMAEMAASAYHLEQICSDNAATPPSTEKLTLEQVSAPLKKACLARSDVVYRRNNIKKMMAKASEQNGDEDGGLIWPL